MAKPVETNWTVEWRFDRQSAFSSLSTVLAAVLLALALPISIFWFSGAASLLPFSFVASMIALLWLLHHVRGAGDREYIAMRPSLLRVERCHAGQISRIEFNPRWVRVEPDRFDGSLVRLSGQGRSVVVGGFLPKQFRRQLANEFRWALQHLED